MSTSTFLAWSLLVAGLIALALVLTSRNPAVDTTDWPRPIVLALGILLMGGMLTSLGALLVDIELPRWTDLLGGLTWLLIGVSFVLPTKRREATRTMRIYGSIMMAFGAVVFATSAYHYAIRLGTVGSWSLS